MVVSSWIFHGQTGISTTPLSLEGAGLLPPWLLVGLGRTLAYSEAVFWWTSTTAKWIRHKSLWLMKLIFDKVSYWLDFGSGKSDLHSDSTVLEYWYCFKSLILYCFLWKPFPRTAQWVDDEASTLFLCNSHRKSSVGLVSQLPYCICAACVKSLGVLHLSGKATCLI